MIRLVLMSFIAATLLVSLHAQAEYRVYQYLVKPRNTLAMVTAAEARHVRSTLNPVAFLAYHGGASSVDATLMRSWMCPGSTARKEYCLHPSERVAQ